MKKEFFSFLFIISAAILLTALCVAGVALAYDEHDDRRINHDSTLKIIDVPTNSTGGTECKMVYSDVSVTKDYFIPTKTKTEWDAFVANKPAGIIVGPCQCLSGIISGYSYPNINYGSSATATRSITNGSCSTTVSCSNTGAISTSPESCTCNSGFLYSSSLDACVQCQYDSDCGIASGYYCQGASGYNNCNPYASSYTCQKKCWAFTESTALVTFLEGDTVNTTSCSVTSRDNPKCLDGHPNATPTCPTACNDVRDNLGTVSGNSCCEYYNAFGCGDWDARTRYRCSERATYTRYYGDVCRRSLTSTAINGRVDAYGTCSTYCGDGYCTSSTGEDCSTCQTDCGVCVASGYCGDGICNWGEDYDYCTQDCGYSYNNNYYCGDGYCNLSSGSENSSACPQDCGYLYNCGDGYCEMTNGEDVYTCPYDCY